jgi:hypothetical protein
MISILGDAFQLAALPFRREPSAEDKRFYARMERRRADLVAEIGEAARQWTR